jgi:hypothetical protein
MPKIGDFSLFTLETDATKAWLKTAEGWLKTADRHVKLAERALQSNPPDHAESVTHSCKAIEFSAKGLLVMAGVEFPKEHNVGIGLVYVWQALAGTDATKVDLLKRHVARVGWLCDVVTPLQMISEYGYAEKLSDLVVNETDACTFFGYSKECLYDIAQKVLGGLKDKSLNLDRKQLTLDRKRLKKGS